MTEHPEDIPRPTTIDVRVGRRTCLRYEKSLLLLVRQHQHSGAAGMGGIAYTSKLQRLTFLLRRPHTSSPSCGHEGGGRPKGMLPLVLCSKRRCTLYRRTRKFRFSFGLRKYFPYQVSNSSGVHCENIEAPYLTQK